jgi:hypothetical protein
MIARVSDYRKRSKNVKWKANPGGQDLFLRCPYREVLLHGDRGGGKTEALLMDFVKGVGRGWGSKYTGVLFRCEYKHLEDVVRKSKRLFNAIFPDAYFLKAASDYKWVFPGGEELLFRHAKKEADYDAFHGHEYPWQGYEELTNWLDPKFYLKMESTCRSSIKGMRKRRVSTTNPFGLGHTWVKKRFIDPAPTGGVIEEVFTVKGITIKKQRQAIRCSFLQNPWILENDPEYIVSLMSITDPNVRAAWLYGSWDIVAGGAFDDLWDREKHVLKSSEVQIPSSWPITRSFDWGSSSPFSVGWHATSPGGEILIAGKPKYLPRGTKIRLAEWYGAKHDRDNEGLRLTNAQIAEGILEREREFGFVNVHPGAADNQIFNDGNGFGVTAYQAYEDAGVYFVPAPKGPGSRRTRMALLRDRLFESTLDLMEKPGLFIMDRCVNTISQIPVLARDPDDWEKVNKGGEDHIYDELTYELIAYENSVSMIDA